MYEAVFISDLHLDPLQPQISERFYACMDWAADHTKSLYILGDFFHVWPGDDGFDAWSLAIVKRLKNLKEQGLRVYFMVGNRDFLIGKRFVQESGVILLREPTLIQMNQLPVLLVHGDRYCTKDKAHQWFRALTRNRVFVSLFLQIPFKLRNKIVNGVRKHSQLGQYKPEIMQVVPEVVLAHMQKFQVQTLIHGHTHTPGLTEHYIGKKLYRHYILSDWDDKPQLLCYDKTKGFQFIHGC